MLTSVYIELINEKLEICRYIPSMFSSSVYLLTSNLTYQERYAVQLLKYKQAEFTLMQRNRNKILLELLRIPVSILHLQHETKIYFSYIGLHTNINVLKGLFRPGRHFTKAFSRYISR